MDSWLLPVVLLLGLTAVDTLQCDDQLTQNFTGRLHRTIPPNADADANSSCVTELLLDGNRVALNQTDRQALESYPALAELHLDENLLTHVPKGFFFAAPNLKTLSLARNRIDSLDSEAFSGLDLLEHLDLSENQLSSLPEQLIGGLRSLQVLNLRGNPWNCSCLLLSAIGEINAANVSIGGTSVTCTSPPEQAGSEVLTAVARCSSSPPDNGTDPLKPTTPGHSEQPTAVQSTTQNYNSTNGRRPVLGNSWKFTACVAALALVTSGLIVCAVKGPSWYKLFHNYRHRRLQQDGGDDDGGDNGNQGNFTTTIFRKKGSYRTPQTFGFQNQDWQVEEDEDEDEYFEDPYIKGEGNEENGDETPTEP